MVRFTNLLVSYIDLETTRDRHNDLFEDTVLGRIPAKEEKRVRKKIKVAQTQTLNKELSAEISLTAVEEDDSNTTAGSWVVSLGKHQNQGGGVGVRRIDQEEN